MVAIVDARQAPDGELVAQARARGIRVIEGAAVLEAKGSTRVSGARVATIDPAAFTVTGPAETLACDTIASSGGYSPVIHLASHTGARPTWSDDVLGFVPSLVKGVHAAGSARGIHDLTEGLADGMAKACEALSALGKSADVIALPQVDAIREGAACALYQVPHEKPTLRAPKQFVDLQNDVTAAAIELATREGFESIEHVKRYTAMGFGTDQASSAISTVWPSLPAAWASRSPRWAPRYSGPTTRRSPSAPSPAAIAATSSTPSVTPPCTSGTWKTAPSSRTWASGSAPGIFHKRSTASRRPCMMP
ncbi:hypothetical protein Q427_09010 [Halomonas sp. BC04]|nr:hypothetical protein Q427_09010 [Halomonas sp. BC04]